jgi:hypothetical protein
VPQPLVEGQVRPAALEQKVDVAVKGRLLAAKRIDDARRDRLDDITRLSLRLRPRILTWFTWLSDHERKVDVLKLPGRARVAAGKQASLGFVAHRFAGRVERTARIRRYEDVEQLARHHGYDRSVLAHLSSRRGARPHAVPFRPASQFAPAVIT